MVCRENKGRSAIMGVVKALEISYGNPAFHDAEIQSGIHQIKHEGDALNEQAPVSVDEQIAMMKRVREEVRSLPFISEEEKYRVSSRRPGMITRLDQEISRLEKGVDENGNKLRPAQLNNAADLYAIQRLSSMLERVGPARTNFLETNARHRGITMEEAETEWRQLVDRPGHMEEHSKIRDETRESLAAAGIDPSTQMSLGVSGRSIMAMEEMENRRLAAVDNLEKRPAITDEHVVERYVPTTGNVVKCEECGQFGHEAADCPNTADLATARDAARRKAQARTAAARGGLARKLEAGGDLREDYTGAAQARFATFEEFQADVEDARQQGLHNQIKDNASAYKAAVREEEAATERIAAREPKQSAYAKSVAYNPDSGVMVIERQPDHHGNERPPIIRRCQPHEADELIAELQHRPAGEVLSPWANRDTNKFANAADAQAALTSYRCPTCGQWASLNTSHQCPVEGGPSETADALNRRDRMEYNRERRDALKSGVLELDEVGARKFMIGDHAKVGPQALKGRDAEGNIQEVQLLNGHFTKRTPVVKELRNGNIPEIPVQMDFPDGKVSGSVSAWEGMDKDGNVADVMSVKPINGPGGGGGLRCDCSEYAANGTCRHINATAVRLANTYQAYPVDDYVPGDQLNLVQGRDGRMVPARPVIAQDSRQLNYSPGIGAVQDIRRARIDSELETWISNRAEGQGATTMMVERPTDSEGQPVDWPTTWAAVDDPDNAIDLTDSNEVKDRMRARIKKKIVTDPVTGEKHEVRARVNQSKDPDGYTVQLPSKFNKLSPNMRQAGVEVLADNLGVNPSSFGENGFFIPGDTATVYERLEYASGNSSPRVRGPRTVRIASYDDTQEARTQAAGAFGRSTNPPV